MDDVDDVGTGLSIRDYCRKSLTAKIIVSSPPLDEQKISGQLAT